MLSSVEDVKKMLELAAKVDKALPPVKVKGAKALWPDFCLTEAEKKALRVISRDGEPDFEPTQEQIDIWYHVCAEWIKAFQGSDEKRQQWIVLWLKSCGCPSKIIEKKLGICRTKVWYVYDKGMACLLNFLRIKYSRDDLIKLEAYRPELISPYPRGKITGISAGNVLKEWLQELSE